MNKNSEIMEYYMRRKNRYFFRSQNSKLVITGNGIDLRALSLIGEEKRWRHQKKGDKFIITTE